MFDRPTVVIMSGLPGSGKSTWANAYQDVQHNNYSGDLCPIISSDHFFINKDTGEYKFSANMLPQSHAYCFSTLIAALTNRDAWTVIVDNCGSKLHDVSPYILASQAFSYDHIIICCNASVETCLARQTHNVPEHTMRNMKKNLIDMYAKLPAGWNVKHINTEK